MTTLPTWEEFMIPALRVLTNGEVRSRREIFNLVAKELKLNDAQMGLATTSGELTYQNRVGWAISYLQNVGALNRPARGFYNITDAGKFLLKTFPNGVNEREVTILSEDQNSPIQPYVATKRTSAASSVSVTDSSILTPIEQVQIGVERIRSKVADELLQRIQEKDPAFFEQAVVDLLVAMGYGGAHGTGSVTQLTGDGGIDGVIDQDVLGLSRVYIQAKRYAPDNGVGRPEVQSFVGALLGKADGGVFITTSYFTTGAQEYVAKSPTRIILIDGSQLTDLMIQFGVGVQTTETYSIVEIDEDFFA